MSRAVAWPSAHASFSGMQAQPAHSVVGNAIAVFVNKAIQATLLLVAHSLFWMSHFTRFHSIINAVPVFIQKR